MFLFFFIFFGGGVTWSEHVKCNDKESQIKRALFEMDQGQMVSRHLNHHTGGKKGKQDTFYKQFLFEHNCCKYTEKLT